MKGVQELYESVRQAHYERETDSRESNGKEYQEHLPLEVLEAGIKSGRYKQVSWTPLVREGNIGSKYIVWSSPGSLCAGCA